MKLPDIVNSQSAQKQSIVLFKGYNANHVISDGEMSDMTNLSGLEYPCLSPRKSRAEIVADASTYEAFGAKGTVLCHVAADTFYYNCVYKGALGAYGGRQLVPFQDRVLIWPDKKYYDVTDDVLGDLANSYSQTGLIFAIDKITGTAFTGFAVGDAVTISGCTENEENNKSAIITAVSATELTFASNTFTAGTEMESVTIARTVPDMEHICVANNRVWGCKGNTIYGSKLGDATNWNYFPGLSTDSYTVDVASDGDFIGCTAFSSYVAFFKENYIHKLLGTKPSNFQTTTIIARGMGLQAGSAKSLSIVNEVLYYKAQIGVVAFTGGVPELVSKFGNVIYSSAVAANDGRRYYVSLYNGSVWSLFVYDTFTGLWHKEDATQVVDFAVIGDDIYYLGGNKVYKMNSGAEVVAWSATLGEFTEQVAEKKGYSKLQLRAELPVGSTLKVEYNPDGVGWKIVYAGVGAYRKGFYIPIIPTRCDSFVIRLSGTGPCKLYQFNRQFQYGSDVR